MLFLERLEEVSVGAEAVLAGDGIFEDDLTKRHQGKRHVSAKENEETDCGKIGGPVGNGRPAQDKYKRELRNNDGSEEREDVDKQNWFFAKPGVRVKNDRDEKG